MRKLIAALMLLALVAGTAAAQEATLEQIKKTGKFRIGYRHAEPPMSFVGKDGTPMGYSIDLCTRIATAAKTAAGRDDISIEYVPVTSENRFSALQENKIDLLCGSTTRTISRGEHVDFTLLTFATGASLMSLRKTPVNILGDLQGKKIAVVKGTTTIDVLKKALQDAVTEAQVVEVDSATQGISLLDKEEVAAFCSDQIVLIGQLVTAENPNRYVISDSTFSYEPFALALRRNDSDFRLVADRTLAQLYRSGQIAEIYKKWFGAFSDRAPSAIAALYQINALPE